MLSIGVKIAVDRSNSLLHAVPTLWSHCHMVVSENVSVWPASPDRWHRCSCPPAAPASCWPGSPEAGPEPEVPALPWVPVRRAWPQGLRPAWPAPARDRRRAQAPPPWCLSLLCCCTSPQGSWWGGHCHQLKNMVWVVC